ncbi:protein TIC 20-II, chloroplastic [Apium graveolens]|uniref:protein TIC 20-II, chloroplastic n=1 Tax=Apium graveolens TaxID=4045 RepID=UPI003D79C3C4
MASLSLLRFSLPLHTPNPTRTPILPHPLRSTLHIPNPTRLTSPHKPLKLSASSTSTPVPDRLISSAAYFFPLFNGLQYGSFLFQQYPRILGPAIGPILPFFNLYRSVPYASYVAFLALYVGIVRNDRLSRYVRFNTMQAVVLDVLLVVPLLIQRIFNPGRSGIGFNLTVIGYNFLFCFVVFCFVYSLVHTVLGKTPFLPFVADAAGRQF